MNFVVINNNLEFMSLIDEIKHLKGNTKGLFLLITYRTRSFFTKNTILKIVGLPIRLLYKITINWILGVEIPDTTIIGKGLQIYHGQGLVINSKCIIGENVLLRHNTTIGNSKKGGNCPVIGDNVEIGSNSVIIGEIVIGNNSIIGAGSVVLKDIPPYEVWGGVPARFIKKRIINDSLL